MATAALDLTKANPLPVKWYFILLGNIFITLVAISCGKHEILPFVNYYIPDSGHYELWVFFPTDKGISNGFLNINTFLYNIGVQSLCIYNTLLLICCIYFCSVFQTISEKAVSLARTSIAFNPYILISVLGPTKEINLTFFSLFSLYLFSKKPISLKIMAFVPAIVVMGIRPQFGAVLVFSLICYLLVKIIKNPITICVSAFVTFLVLNSIPSINNIISNAGGEELEYYRISNFYAVALILKAMQENPVLQIVALAIKAILAMFAPIARPNAILSSNIPLLDWGYNFMGWFLFPLNLSFLLLFLNKKKVIEPQLSPMGQLIIVFTFLGIFSVIISPIFSARYLFPYAPGIAACFSIHSVKVRNRILVFSFVIIALAFISSAIFIPIYWYPETNMVPFQFLSWI